MKRLLPVVCAVAFFAGELSAGGVSGRVAFTTKRGQSPVVNETLVWLEPVNVKITKRSSGTFQMTTRGKMLLPHILAVPAGSTVSFPNDDPFLHNLFSLSGGNGFDLGLYRRGPGKSQHFDNPGVVNIYCNVHPNMSAVIHVMTSPYYAFADAGGTFSLADVPAGKYTIVAWNEQGGTVRTAIDVPEDGLGGLALTFDTRNFRLVQHMNKEGKPYQAPPTRDY